MYNKILQYGAKKGYLSLVKLAERKGVDIHRHNEQALRISILHKHIDIVRYLIIRGANVKAYYDQNVLKAACNNDMEMVKLLIENGGDMYARTGAVIYEAVKHDNMEMVNYLLYMTEQVKGKGLYGISNSSKYLFLTSALESASHNNKLDILKHILTKMEYNDYDNNIKKCLIISIKYHNKEITEYLIKHILQREDKVVVGFTMISV